MTEPITFPVIKMNVGDNRGVTVIFSAADIIDATITQEIDPLSATLPISTLEFSVHSTSTDFSIFSSGTFFNQLSKRQPIIVWENVDETEYLMGKFYLDTWKNDDTDKLSLTAMDVIGVLDTAPYDGSFWATATSLPDILYAILHPVGVDYTIDGALSGVTLIGWIPPSTCREALQLVCFAAGAMVSTAKSLVLNVIKMKLPYTDASYSDDVLSTEMDGDQTIELLPFITKAELISHDYMQGVLPEDIFSATLVPGDYKIVFDKPYWNVVATGAGDLPTYITTEDGAYCICTEKSTVYPTLCEMLDIPGAYLFGPNCLYLHVYPPGGAISVVGYPWVDTKQSFIFTETIDPVDAPYITNNTLLIDKATLVTVATAPDILTRVVNYHKQRYIQHLTLFPRTTSKIGDEVRAATHFAEYIIGVIEKQEIDLAGGFLLTTDIVGIEELPA